MMKHQHTWLPEAHKRCRVLLSPATCEDQGGIHSCNGHRGDLIPFIGIEHLPLSMRWKQLRVDGCDMRDSTSSTTPLGAGACDQEFLAGTWALPVYVTTWPVFSSRSANSDRLGRLSLIQHPGIQVYM
jgi:hypothetical protein